MDKLKFPVVYVTLRQEDNEIDCTLPLCDEFVTQVLRSLSDSKVLIVINGFGFVEK